MSEQRGKWRVCRARRKDGTLYGASLGLSFWDVYKPDGDWNGAFESWVEAMDWATNLGTRVEYWLQIETGRTPR